MSRVDANAVASMATAAGDQGATEMVAVGFFD